MPEHHLESGTVPRTEQHAVGRHPYAAVTDLVQAESLRPTTPGQVQEMLRTERDAVDHNCDIGCVML